MPCELPANWRQMSGFAVTLNIRMGAKKGNATLTKPKGAFTRVHLLQISNETSSPQSAARSASAMFQPEGFELQQQRYTDFS